jgi:hypothetical protein
MLREKCPSLCQVLLVNKVSFGGVQDGLWDKQMIYTITVMTCRSAIDSRTWGYFDTFMEAESAVMSNDGDIYEMWHEFRKSKRASNG